MSISVAKFITDKGYARYISKGSSKVYKDHNCTDILAYELTAPWDGETIEVVSQSGIVYYKQYQLIQPTPPSANPKQAFGDKKIPLGLVPRSFINGTSLGLAEGMVKYGAWNFRSTKVEAMTYASAVLRHFEAYIHGEECDPITKVPHLYSAAAGIAILIDTKVQGTLIDNRPPKQDTSAQVKEIEEVLVHLKELFKDHNPVHYTCQTP